MFHAEIRPAKIFKQVIESLKEVVNECTFECTNSQMQVQAMDSGHVSLVSLELAGDKMHLYRCERNIQLGVNIGSLHKMMKCCGNDDCVVLTSDSSSDVLNVRLADLNEERVSDFSMKLMEIDSQHLGIPQQEYKAAVKIPSGEFAKICRDIASFGDTVTIEVTPNHVAFSASGDIGTGKVFLKASTHLDTVKDEARLKDEDVKEEKIRVKEEGESKRKMEEGDAGDKKRRRKNDEDVARSVKAVKAAEGVQIRCDEPVTLQFALRYLTMYVVL